jgi:probable rRNA maturation factor
MGVHDMVFAKSTMDLRESLRGVEITNRQRQFKIFRPSVALFCVNVLRSFSDDVMALSVVFVKAGQMRAINKEYLGHDYSTDVLSFFYEGTVVDERPFLGEIIIAPEVAAIHAARYGTSPEREIRRLLVHGILHLLGYNHENDRGQMNRLQKKLLRRKLLAQASLWRR